MLLLIKMMKNVGIVGIKLVISAFASRRKPSGVAEQICNLLRARLFVVVCRSGADSSKYYSEKTHFFFPEIECREACPGLSGTRFCPPDVRKVAFCMAFCAVSPC